MPLLSGLGIITMRYFQYLIIVALFAACGKSAEPETAATDIATASSGKELFDGVGNCTACHKPDAKIIGPSIIEIATIYKNQNGNMVEFLKGNADPIVDPSQYEVMKTNFAITKKMSDAELQALSDYMYSHLK